METNVWILMVLCIGLCNAVLIDIATHRIPNWLTLSIAMTCLALQGWFGQWDGLLLAGGGLVVGLLCFMPSYLFGAMGAGDVKLVAAIGTALGPWGVFVTAVMTVIAGGAIALLYIGLRGGMGAMIRRYGCMLTLLVQGHPQYLAPAANEAAAQRFPYAMAIACGTALSLWCLSGQCVLTV
ncbi:MAG TPA: A24 family peptidase [Gammaproteobacteria bacterium]